MALLFTEGASLLFLSHATHLIRCGRPLWMALQACRRLSSLCHHHAVQTPSISRISNYITRPSAEKNCCQPTALDCCALHSYSVKRFCSNQNRPALQEGVETKSRAMTPSVSSVRMTHEKDQSSGDKVSWQKKEDTDSSPQVSVGQVPHLAPDSLTDGARAGDEEVDQAHQVVVSHGALDLASPEVQASAELSDQPSPKPSQPSYNLAVYIKQSEVLQKLLTLGVDLSVVEKVPEAADFIVQARWDSDIHPRLLFLHDIGVADADLGRVLTKNPLILKKSIEEMQELISYLKSKKFPPEGICHIVTRAPLVLLMTVAMVDKKLGFLQQSFGLSGNEVRCLAIKGPKLVVWKLQKLKDTRYYMKEMLGFSDAELKAMLIVAPKVFLTDKYQMGKRFDYLHNVIGIRHDLIAVWPSILRTRLHLLKARHRFLLHVGRAQFDPTKENYVSLKALVSGTDRNFCHFVAKASTAEFNNFLKTI